MEINHYNYIEENGQQFSSDVKSPFDISTMLVAHGDKCYQYKDKWKKHGVPFHIGVMIYLLSYILPWSSTVRKTDNGWVLPDNWVVDMFHNNQEIKDAVKKLPKLFHGKIMPYCDCPWKAKCQIAQANVCYHDGENPFSCGAARGFELTDGYK